MYVQLQSFLTKHNIHEQFQSGFRPRHSTETALLRVFNDLLLAVDSGSPAVLMLLDLSAAFDTVDHGILLQRLEHYVGITGSALCWFRSYLAERTFSVQLGHTSSDVASLTCGVPQGSILGPILFLLYMLPLGDVFQKHKISFHCFADDVQIYMPLRSLGQDTVQAFLDCLIDVKAWMRENFLKFNESKTEIIFFGGNTPTTACFAENLGPLSSNIQSNVRNLGVIFDNHFNFDKQISAVVKASFFQLRLLAKTKAYFSQADLEKTIHAFVTCRLDYCNSLYIGMDKSSINRLQLIQNAAARLLSGKKKA